MDDRRLERLRWRCRRGLLELDVMLQDFLAQHYAGLTPPEQQAFDLLLETPDVTLLAYLQGDQDPSDKELVEIVAKIRQ